MRKILNLLNNEERNFFMKKNKFTDSQIAFILRQAEEGTAVAEVCLKSGGIGSDILTLAQVIRRFEVVLHCWTTSYNVIRFYMNGEF